MKEKLKDSEEKLAFALMYVYSPYLPFILSFTNMPDLVNPDNVHIYVTVVMKGAL